MCRFFQFFLNVFLYFLLCFVALFCFLLYIVSKNYVFSETLPFLLICLFFLKYYVF